MKKQIVINMKIAVCLHLYHIDMWEDISNYLDNITISYTLYVNIVTDNSEIINKIKKYKNDVTITISPNVGMDIGGFLYSYKNISDDTDLVLKIHTKKGLGGEKVLSDSVKKFGVTKAERIGKEWFSNLMDGVLKNENYVNNVISEFKTDENCGMIGFKSYNNFEYNLTHMNDLFNLWDVYKLPIDSKFVGGTIFWVRNNILKKYLTSKNIDNIIKILPSGYVCEPSYNHAMERIFGCFVYFENKILKTNIS